jgi:hypothetical protein
MSLNDLMSLSARVQQFSIQHDGGMRTCHACQRQGTSLKACAKCHFFWYCDKVRHPGQHTAVLDRYIDWFIGLPGARLA